MENYSAFFLPVAVEQGSFILVDKKKKTLVFLSPQLIELCCVGDTVCYLFRLLTFALILQGGYCLPCFTNEHPDAIKASILPGSGTKQLEKLRF